MTTGPSIRWLPLAALTLFASAAAARPLLIPAQILHLPPAPGVPDSEEYPRGVFGEVAVDDGTLMVGGSRPINVQGDRRSGIYIFERDSAGQWEFAGALTEWVPGEFDLGEMELDGAVAAMRSASGEGIQVFERGAAGWAPSGALPVESDNHAVIRIEDGSIFLRQFDIDPEVCLPPFQEFRQVNGAWVQVATIGGERCERAELSVNDGRAMIVYSDYPPSQRPAEVFAPGQPAWTLTGNIPQSAPGNLGITGTIRGDTAVFNQNLLIYRNSGGAWLPAGRVGEPERELDPSYAFGAQLRGGHLFLRGDERDYELPTRDENTQYDWSVVRVYREISPGKFTSHARLNADSSLVAPYVSDDGRYVASFGYGRNSSGYSEDYQLYVFEIPDTSSFPGTRQETFHTGNYASWTTTAGQYEVVTSGASRVLRQRSISGDAGAHLSTIDWEDQSIEADMRPIGYAGFQPWFGLVTRRTDAQNYYYVTFRLPNIVSIRRMRNGVYTELARTEALEDFQLNRTYRVRLESVGNQHAVFIDGFPLVRAIDDTLTHGHPGVASFRVAFELDNAVVSGGTRVLLRLDSARRDWSDGWERAAGTWETAYDDETPILRQTDTQGDARWVSTVPAGYQVVSARVRPQQFGDGYDPWVGLAAHVKDDSNYYYITLRRSGTLSLRRLINGQIQEFATVPQAVALGSWYDLRLEIVGTQIRAYVNGDLRIETKDPSLRGSYGRNAVLMWKTAADVESYIAYQP